MTDLILILVIAAFFVSGAFLVRVLDQMIVRAGLDTDSEDEAEPGAQ